MPIVLATILTLCFFALNSIFCRMALREQSIDAASFTLVRTLSAALVLLAIVLVRKKKLPPLGLGNFSGAIALSLYLIAFSLAYIDLSAGTGALILFGSVQLTMMLSGLARKEKFGITKALGFALAAAGLIYLVLPGVEAPNPLYALSMVLAGVGWGAYSLLGRGSKAPIEDTAANFIKALPICAVALIPFWRNVFASGEGWLYAVLSGGLASGIGYSIWYSVLPRLSRLNASVVQLLVPVLAAGMGTLWLSEPFTARIAISFVLTLGGICLALFSKTDSKNPRH